MTFNQRGLGDCIMASRFYLKPGRYMPSMRLKENTQWHKDCYEWGQTGLNRMMYDMNGKPRNRISTDGQIEWYESLCKWYREAYGLTPNGKICRDVEHYVAKYIMRDNKFIPRDFALYAINASRRLRKKSMENYNKWKSLFLVTVKLHDFPPFNEFPTKSEIDTMCKNKKVIIRKFMSKYT